MRLALTVWNGQMATVADFAERMLLIQSDGRAITTRLEIAAPGADAACWRARCAAEGVTTLLCDAISRHLHQHLTHAGLAIVDGCSGPVEAVLEAWLAGRIARCQGRTPRCHRRRGGRGFRLLPAASCLSGTAPMRVAISCTGSDSRAVLDPRFGRSQHFLVGSAAEDLAAHANPTATQAEHGAGIRTAEFIAALGVDTVITGAVGTKAMQVLRAAGVRVFACDAVPARVAWERLARGELSEITA